MAGMGHYAQLFSVDMGYQIFVCFPRLPWILHDPPDLGVTGATTALFFLGWP
jgi:hypothetical protein